ncbi:MAG TPA: FlgD immunoglobulin-like domain containing protein, partial [Rhodothermia bacterium]
SRGEIGILAYNDLGRPIEVIRQDKTTEHGEIMRTTVEAGQFFFIPLPKDQNVAITDGIDTIVYTPSKRMYRKDFPYYAGVLQPLTTKADGSQEFELLLFDGTGDPVELPITTATEGSDDLPSRIALHANHPNPFNESTTLRYEIPDLSSVRLQIFDIMGRRVRTLVDGVGDAGAASATWDGLDDAGRSLSSGAYLARLEVGDYVLTRTMVLAR